MKIIDLSLEIDNTCMTCGTDWHKKVELNSLGTIASVGRNTSSIVLGSHTATHVDSPKHFFEEGDSIENTDLDVLCGEVTVVDFTYLQKGDRVELSDVEKYNITERMIFRFDWFKKWKKTDYYQEFPFFSLEAAEYLVKKGMRLMALDTPSPDSGNNIFQKGGEDSPVHKLLLKNNIVIVEYLTNTDNLDINKKLVLYALPLKLKGVDGSPARVIVVEE